MDSFAQCFQEEGGLLHFSGTHLGEFLLDDLGFQVLGPAQDLVAPIREHNQP